MGGSRAATTRHNSSRPPFNTNSAFKFVDPPAPGWRLGDGLPEDMKEWKQEVDNVKRRTWDLTAQENAR